MVRYVPSSGFYDNWKYKFENLASATFFIKIPIDYVHYLVE